MNHLHKFTNFITESDKPEKKPKPPKDLKRCIGMCDRKFFIKNGEPVIYCPSCDRILK
jgi:hypothetical protein